MLCGHEVDQHVIQIPRAAGDVEQGVALMARLPGLEGIVKRGRAGKAQPLLCTAKNDIERQGNRARGLALQDGVVNVADHSKVR